MFFLQENQKSIKAIRLFVFGFFLCLSFTVISTFFLSTLDPAVPTSLHTRTEGTVFVLDAGHGGEDCGTIGKNGTYEKDLNLEIAMQLGQALSDMGYAVIYTRTEDKLLYKEEENIKGLRKIYDLKNRVKIAETYPNAIFISLHMNSFSEEKYSGLQVFYSGNHKSSRMLAESVQKQVKEKLQPQNNRSIREGSGLYLLDNLSCPAILIECGFLSNPEECEKLCKKEYQKQLSFAILCGIMNVK